MKVQAVIAFGLLACILYGLGAGLRSDIGILLMPLAAHCGIAYEDVSFCIAVMQIVFGATQPFFGILAMRRSNRFVLFLGAVLLGLSVVGMIEATSFWQLMLALGILFGGGAGALSFGLILTSAIYFVGKRNAMIISGMLNAAAGMIGFMLSPVLQFLISSFGLIPALTFLLIPIAVLVPVLWVVTSRDPAKSDIEEADAKDQDTSLSSLFQAFHNRTFLLLIAGFSTCGFHMVIIESHLFSQFVFYGIDGGDASWAFSVYGIATILGALASGYVSSLLPKGWILGFLYGFRAVWVAAYLFLMPKTVLTAVLFATGLGFTGDATVSPTAGLVNEHFSIRQVATLMGFLFLCHQVGAFCSAWFGGILFTATGNYTAIWLIDIALCLFASIMSWRIQPLRRVKETDVSLQEK